MLEQMTPATQFVFRPLEKQIEVFKPGKESVVYADSETPETSFLPEFKLSLKQIFAD